MRRRWARSRSAVPNAAGSGRISGSDLSMSRLPVWSYVTSVKAKTQGGPASRLLLSPQALPAVDRHDGPVDVRGQGRGEKQGEMGHVARLSRTAQGNLLHQG